MFDSIRQSYAAHFEARVEFLTALQKIALILGTLFVGCFTFIGSYGSAAGTSIILLSIFLSLRWRQKGHAFLASCWLAATFLVEPTTAIVLSQGIESPYIVWLIVPIFTAGGLLGAKGAVLAALSAILTYTVLFLFDPLLRPLNELLPKYYDFMYFLSFTSAALFTSVLAWIAISAIERDSIAAQNSAAAASVANEELREKETLLRQELYERDKLYAVISHELRTPAATLKMMFDDHVIHHLNSPEKSSINDTLEHMLAVMEDMRLAREPEQLNRAPRADGLLSDVITQATKMAQRFTEDSGLVVVISKQPGREELSEVPKQLIRQITINLVKNCAVHAEATKLDINIKWSQQGEDLEYRITFSDDGRGIADKYIPTLFDSFSRADSSADGSGIGLNVCKEYAQKSLGGDLTYSTSASGGAAFVLTALLKKASQASEESATEQVQDQLNDRKILLVEDSDVLRSLTAKMLTKKGAWVTEARDGLEAMKLFGTTHFDLVLTDLHMPNMSGIELTRSLRGLGVDLPIIGLTAAFGEESKLLQQAGTNEILIKPLAIDRLEKALTEIEGQGARVRTNNGAENSEIPDQGLKPA